MHKFLILHGPNLNLLGLREPDIYGSVTLEQIETAIRQWAELASVQIVFEQSNSEGALIDKLHACREWADGVVVNPGGLGHTSISLADAIRAIGVPTMEVHLTNIFSREPFRQRSVIAHACVGIVAGLQADGYIAACSALKRIIDELSGRET